MLIYLRKYKNILVSSEMAQVVENLLIEDNDLLVPILQGQYIGHRGSVSLRRQASSQGIDSGIFWAPSQCKDRLSHVRDSHVKDETVAKPWGSLYW